MRFHVNQRTVHVGHTVIHGVSRVTGLDAPTDPANNTRSDNQKLSPSPDRLDRITFSSSSIQVIEQQLAIIIPCMNEPHALLEGVLYGIPQNCFIIIVSNSEHTAFRLERNVLEAFCTDTQRSSIIVHQKSGGLAQAFMEAGYEELIEENATGDCPKIRDGKGEAMIIGVTIAKLSGKRFVGFIDADNFVPGAVHEYCKVFAAGLSLGLGQCDHRFDHCDKQPTNGNHIMKDPKAMVRIQWKSKPKIEEGRLVAKDSGRCSQVVNRWMNRLLSILSGTDAEDDMIQTANAGEHAMTMNLAIGLCFATGYAVEPNELIDIWERSVPRTELNFPAKLVSEDDGDCSSRSSRRDALMHVDEFGEMPPPRNATPGSSPSSSLGSSYSTPSPYPGETHIVQIQTRNPHIHDFRKGEDHIKRMQVEGLMTILRSPLTPDDLRIELRHFIEQEIGVSVETFAKENPCRIYPPISSLDFDLFRAVLRANPEAVQRIGSGAGLFFGN